MKREPNSIILLNDPEFEGNYLRWLLNKLEEQYAFTCYVDYAIYRNIITAFSSFNGGRTENGEPYISCCGLKIICLKKEDLQKLLVLK